VPFKVQGKRKKLLNTIQATCRVCIIHSQQLRLHLVLIWREVNLSAHHLRYQINPLNAELNPICHLLALLGAHHILHVGKLRVKLKTSDLTDKTYGQT